MASAAAWADLDLLCGVAVENGQGFNWFHKLLRELVAMHRWSAWGEEKDFERRALVVYKIILGIDYADKRFAQLRTEDSDFLVYHKGNGFDCPDTHFELNGIVLPVAHEFWDIWTPPNNFLCDCYLTGARNLRGSQRVGGLPEKELPDWWDDPPRGPAPDFVGFGRPNLRRIVQAALSDEIT